MDDTDSTEKKAARPSLLLLGAGVACLIVAVLAIIGLDPLTLVDGSAAGWIAVGIAVSVGLALVLIPGRSGKTSR